MTKKKTAKKLAPVSNINPNAKLAGTPPEVQIPSDLESQVQSLRAFATTYNCLSVGSFKPNEFQTVAQCLEFIKSIYTHALDVASAHESSDLVPELKIHKEELAKVTTHPMASKIIAPAAEVQADA